MLLAEPIFLNIFLNDLFFFIQETKLCNFADDNTVYACDTSVLNLLCRLTGDTIKVNNWFKINSIVANLDKFQIMFLGKDACNIKDFHICGYHIDTSKEVVLLEITTDYELKFSKHIQNLCKKANNMISALLTFRNQISNNQAQILVNAYILNLFIVR